MLGGGSRQRETALEMKGGVSCLVLVNLEGTLCPVLLTLPGPSPKQVTLLEPHRTTCLTACFAGTYPTVLDSLDADAALSHTGLFQAFWTMVHNFHLPSPVFLFTCSHFLSAESGAAPRFDRQSPRNLLPYFSH